MQQPLILSLDPSLATHFSHLTPQALADALAVALPQALAQFANDDTTAAVVQSGDMCGLHPGQVLIVNLATVACFLDMEDAANG